MHCFELNSNIITIICAVVIVVTNQKAHGYIA